MVKSSRRWHFPQAGKEVLPDMITALRGFFLSHGWSEREILPLQVASEEALANIFEHGYQGKEEEVLLLASVEGGKKIEVTILDRAPPFDPQLFLRQQKGKEGQEGARGSCGLNLIMGLSDQVDYSRQGIYNLLCLTRYHRDNVDARHSERHKRANLSRKGE